MNRKRWATVAVGLAVVIGVTLLANPYLPAQLLSPWLRETFRFDSAYAAPDSMVLVIQYGDSGSCPSEAVRHDVVERPDRIVVTLTRTLMPGGRPCTADYQIKLVRITLTAPLGSREVVDGSRTVPVPVTTGSAPFS